MKTADAAVGKWHGILAALGFDERTLSGKHVPCPMCGGVDRFRFDNKEDRGTFFCSHCGAGSGVDLVVKAKGCDYAEGFRLIDGVIGTVQVKKQPDTRGDPRKRLRAIAESCLPVGSGVADYLRSRHLAGPPMGIKRHPGLQYFENGNPAGKYEAMCGLFVDHMGCAMTYHVTYLKDGKKAPVDHPKKLLPRVGPLAGGAIRLFPTCGHIAIAEGIETALAFYELTGIPTWAATSANLLELFKPPEGVQSVTVAGDCDESFTGQASSYSLARRLKTEGFTVDVQIPVRGDWADVLMDARRGT